MRPRVRAQVRQDRIDVTTFAELARGEQTLLRGSWRMTLMVNGMPVGDALFGTWRRAMDAAMHSVRLGRVTLG